MTSRRMTGVVVLCAAAIVVFVVAGTAEAGTIASRIVAVDGSAASPEFWVFQPPISNSSHGVAFSSWLFGSDDGVWLDQGAGPVRLEEGNSVTPARINQAGQILYALTPPGQSNQLVLNTIGGPRQVLAQAGDASPITGSTYTSFGNVRLSNAGDVSFGAGFTDGLAPNSFGLFADMGPGIARVYAFGDAEPTTGKQWRSGYIDWTTGNDLLAFRHAVETPGDLGSIQQGIWKFSAAGLAPVAVEGFPSPIGDAYTQIGLPVVSDDGRVVFSAVAGSGFDATELVLREDAGVYGIIAREGDNAPGVVDGLFHDIRSVVTNADGRVAFVASASSPVGYVYGIWVEQADGSLAPAVLEGQPAAGSPDDIFTMLRHLTVNDEGLIAFTGTSRDTVTYERTDGLWAFDPDGELHLLAHEGQVLFLPDGRSAVVDRIRIEIVSDARDAFAANNELTYMLTFDADTGPDGDAIVVTTLPEPAAVSLLAIGAVGVLTRRKR